MCSIGDVLEVLAHHTECETEFGRIIHVLDFSRPQLSIFDYADQTLLPRVMV